MKLHRLLTAAKISAVLAATLSQAAPATAQTYDPKYPVCLQVFQSFKDYYFDCTYTSMPQVPSIGLGPQRLVRGQSVLRGAESHAQQEAIHHSLRSFGFGIGRAGAIWPAAMFPGFRAWDNPVPKPHDARIFIPHTTTRVSIVKDANNNALSTEANFITLPSASYPASTLSDSIIRRQPAWPCSRCGHWATPAPHWEERCPGI